jgi:putative FmdB family regulatory protein
MPVYEYECQACDQVFEVQQKISDDPLKTCPECQGEVKKLMSMSSFQLKGGGWYADGYASASAKDGNGNGSAAEKAPAEKPAPACDSSSPACAGCPAAAAN